MPQFNQTEFNQGEFNQDSTAAHGTPKNRVFTNPESIGTTSFGQLRHLVAVAVPGVDLDLVDGWIQFRYQAILDLLPWQRIERSATIQTVAPYAVGTVTLLNGSTDVTLDAAAITLGGAFTNAMTGLAIRFEGRDEYYEFTSATPTEGSIDRPYEGPGGSGLAYSIFATVYELPSDCRELRAVRRLEGQYELGRWSKQELNLRAASRATYGRPCVYAPYMDEMSAPPLMQFEVYPVPECVESLVVDYIAEIPKPGGSSIALLPWVRPGAMYHGVRADALEQAGNYQGAQMAEAKFEYLVSEMLKIENRNTPPVQIKMAPRFTRHRMERALNSQPRRSGYW